MSKQSDPYAAWATFFAGGVFFILGLPGLVRFVLTGDTYFRGYKSVPFDLVGGEAALVLGVHLLIGLYFLWLGAQKLTNKK